MKIGGREGEKEKEKNKGRKEREKENRKRKKKKGGEKKERKETKWKYCDMQLLRYLIRWVPLFHLMNPINPVSSSSDISQEIHIGLSYYGVP